MESLDLASLLINLQLRPATTNQSSASPLNHDFSTFHLYPVLPTELRLKILTHALPIHTTIPLNVHILLYDPVFGLYLTFSIAPTKSHKLGSLGSIFPSQKTELSTTELRESRALGLMQVNHEFHDFYIQQFPLALPSGKDGTALAKIRFSPHETVYLKNFDKLLGQPAFVRAINGNCRLQNFWCGIERLAVPVMPLLYTAVPSVAAEKVVRKFEGLKVLETRMWDLFEDSVGEGRKSIRDSMEGHLAGLRERLRQMVEAEGEEERREYVIPKLVLV